MIAKDNQIDNQTVTVYYFLKNHINQVMIQQIRYLLTLVKQMYNYHN